MGKKKDINYKDHLPSAIRDLLHKKGMTQSALSKATEIDPGTISTYYNGTRCPDAINLGKIAKALDVSADYLLGIEKINVPENRSDQPEQFTIKTCGDAVRMLEALLEATVNNSFGFTKQVMDDSFFDQYSGTVRYREKEIDCVTFTFSESGIVKFFEGVKKMNELQKQMPDVFETFKEPMRNGLLSKADSQKLIRSGGFVAVDEEDLPF